MSKNAITVIDQELIDWFDNSFVIDINNPDVVTRKVEELLAMTKDLIEINAKLTGREQKLQAENAELKKQGQCNNLSENWPIFLTWYADYCDLEGSSFTWSAIQHSREDMRYAYQAGYEAALPTPPEGE